MNSPYFKPLLLSIFLLCSSGLSLVYGQNVIKILAIGNSFSQDAAESYLDDLAKAEGIRLIIGNLYIGGCSLETHWKNASGDLPAYSYRKITEGDTVVLAGQTLLSALKDEQWDYITFQQASPFSGLSSTYFPFLTNLLRYVKERATNPHVKFALHQTWAYAANSTHTGFPNYNNNQDFMYHAIVNTVNDVAYQVGIDLIIPVGTAIQNGRSSVIGDHLCRDGYHLSLGTGRYIAACTWYEKLLSRPVIGNPFIPAGVPETEANIAQQAAHHAVLSPNEVTSLFYLAPAPPVRLKNSVDSVTGASARP